jgi:hypothetical protein
VAAFWRPLFFIILSATNTRINTPLPIHISRIPLLASPVSRIPSPLIRIPYPATRIQSPSSTIHHSLFTIHHSLFTIHVLRFTIHLSRIPYPASRSPLLHLPQLQHIQTIRSEVADIRMYQMQHHIIPKRHHRCFFNDDPVHLTV